ncbi:MAG TPA: protein-L-isoaspartate(D-aspartate) O-methyltransferase [Longimicrobiales bacterium]|nr:protein-L-isoaspartate(D-aspartate) O-methyltransferase [Longimicrobiales bacterium]
MRSFEEQRDAMVRTQIQARGVRDRRVLAAMREVPRHRFVPERLEEFAYHDSALPIEADQTISQPLIVAQMAEALEVGEGDRVLDVGTGSGYAAAVLSRMVDQVYTVERHEELLRGAERRFRELGYNNIAGLHSDGTLGWEEHAPYDGIAVAATAPEVPGSLLRQLTIGGHLVIPVQRKGRGQELLRVTRVGEDEYREARMGAVQFVPLVGVEGWDEAGAFGRTVGERAPVRGAPSSSPRGGGGGEDSLPGRESGPDAALAAGARWGAAPDAAAAAAPESRPPGADARDPFGV